MSFTLYSILFEKVATDIDSLGSLFPTIPVNNSFITGLLSSVVDKELSTNINVSIFSVSLSGTTSTSFISLVPIWADTFISLFPCTYKLMLSLPTYDDIISPISCALTLKNISIVNINKSIVKAGNLFILLVLFIYVLLHLLFGI